MLPRQNVTRQVVTRQVVTRQVVTKQNVTRQNVAEPKIPEKCSSVDVNMEKSTYPSSYTYSHLGTPSKVFYTRLIPW